MSDKTLQDFFGENSSSNGELLTFDVAQILTKVSPNFFKSSPFIFTPEQAVTALIVHWFNTNYEDDVTKIRLSQDKTVPLTSALAAPRRVVITRGEESQVKHDYSFSIYTKDNTYYNPQALVGEGSQDNENPESEPEPEPEQF